MKQGIAILGALAVAVAVAGAAAAAGSWAGHGTLTDWDPETQTVTVGRTVLQIDYRTVIVGPEGVLVTSDALEDRVDEYVSFYAVTGRPYPMIRKIILEDPIEDGNE